MAAAQMKQNHSVGKTSYPSKVGFPASASWKISSGKQRGYLEKEGVAKHNEVRVGKGIV